MFRRDSLVIKAFSLLCFEFKLNRPNLIPYVSWGKVQGIIELLYDKIGSATDDYFMCFRDYILAFQKWRDTPSSCSAHYPS